jgi:hypothetical protein
MSVGDHLRFVGVVAEQRADLELDGVASAAARDPP